MNLAQIKQRLNAYFKNPSKPEIVSWVAILLGLILVVIGFFLL